MLIMGVFFRGREGRKELLQIYIWKSKASLGFCHLLLLHVSLTFLTTVQVVVLVFATGKTAF